jgi:hypothetical protein
LAELERELAHVMTVIMRGLMPTSEGHAVAETQIPDETTALSFAASAVAAADTENRSENEMKTGT